MHITSGKTAPAGIRGCKVPVVKLDIDVLIPFDGPPFFFAVVGEGEVCKTPPSNIAHYSSDHWLRMASLTTLPKAVETCARRHREKVAYIRLLSPRLARYIYADVLWAC